MKISFIKLATVFMLLVSGIAATGIGFGLWSGLLTVNTAVNTGTVDLVFVDAYTDDDGVVDDPFFDGEDDNFTNNQLFDYWDAESSADPADFGADPKSHYDKDVAKCEASLLNTEIAVVSQTNTFPSYHCTAVVKITNTGTTPTKVKRFVVTGASGTVNLNPSSTLALLDLSGDSLNDIELNVSGLNICQQIDPGETVELQIWNHTLVDAPQTTTLVYTLDIENHQWNELTNVINAAENECYGTAEIVAPDDITDLLAWYQASSLSLSDGDPVTTWLDSSGNGHTANQTTTTWQPSYVASAIGGQPGVRFDGTADYLTTLPLPIPSNTTVFVAAQNATQTAGGSLWRPVLAAANNPFQSGGTGYGFAYARDGADRIATRLGNGASVDGLDFFHATDGTFEINTFSKSGTSGELYNNGTLIETDTFSRIAGFHTGAYFIGGEASQASRRYAGDILEIIIYDRTLTPAERALVEAYLSDKYGIALGP